MVRLLVLTSFGLLPAAARAACDPPSKLADIDAAAAAGHAAWRKLDVAAFETAREKATTAVDCLGEPVTPRVAAAVHILLGLDSYLAENPDDARTIAWFRGAIAADARADLPADIAPPGNPLRALFDRAKEAPAAADVPLDPPAGTAISVDANPFPARPADRAALVQLTAGREVLWTGIVGASDPAPDWKALGVALPEAAAAAPPPPAPEPEAVATAAEPALPTPPPEGDSGERGSRPRLPLLVAGGGLSLVAGGLYAVAWRMSERYDDFDDPDIETRDDLDSLRARTNTMVWVSAGTLGLGVVLGTGAFLDASPGGGWAAGWRTTW